MSGTTLSPQTRRNLTVLVMAQGFLGAQMPMIFIMGGLAGQSLASNPCFATLPISLIVLGSMLTATPLSAIMQKFGRRTGFVIGSMGGAIGAAFGAWGLATSSFTIFLIGSLFTGVYMSAQGFYRFAAADTASGAETRGTVSTTASSRSAVRMRAPRRCSEARTIAARSSCGNRRSMAPVTASR